MSASVDAEGKPTKREEASERFQKGVELYSNGNLRAALIEFRRAYRLVPTYQLLYNLGQVAAELNDYVEAYNYYRLYLRKGKGKIGDERRSEVAKNIKEVERFVASIKVRVSEEDAEIYIDGESVGQSPIFEPIKVSAGRHKVEVSLEDFASWERTIDLAGRDETRLKVELVPMVSDSRENVANPFREPDPGTKGEGSYSRAFWTTATITGLVAVGTGFAAVQTLRARKVFDDNLATAPNDAANIRLAADELRQFALITDIGIGLTLVGVLSTVLLAGSDDSSRQRQSLRMQLGPRQVALSGEF